MQTLYQQCPACSGLGYITYNYVEPIKVPCDQCGGSGKIVFGYLDNLEKEKVDPTP